MKCHTIWQEVAENRMTNANLMLHRPSAYAVLQLVRHNYIPIWCRRLKMQKIYTFRALLLPTVWQWQTRIPSQVLPKTFKPIFNGNADCFMYVIGIFVMRNNSLCSASYTRLSTPLLANGLVQRFKVISVFQTLLFPTSLRTLLVSFKYVRK